MSQPTTLAEKDPKSPVVPPASTSASPIPASTLNDPAAASPSSITDKSADLAFLWLRRGDRIVVWLTVTLLLILLGVHWLRLSRWGRSPVEISSQRPREYYYSLDINAASWVEWAQLDGIGEKLARRIVADRDERGPFRGPDDVGRVRGIGPKLLNKMKPFLHGGTEPPTPVPDAKQGSKS